MDYFELTTTEKSSLDKFITNFKVVPISDLLDLDDSTIMSDCNYSCSGSCNGSCSGSCKDYCPSTCKGSCEGHCEGYCPSTCKGTCEGTDGW